MPVRNLFDRISLCCFLCSFSAAAWVAQSTHYSVKLVPDFEHQLLRGDETIEFQADARVGVGYGILLRSVDGL
jgi:hypothetical protein